MKMISRMLVLLLSVVFSLMVGGPAFSSMSCSHHLMQMQGDAGASVQHGQHHIPDTHMQDCCMKMGCMSSLAGPVPTRFYEVKPIEPLVLSWNGRLFECIPVLRPELFRAYRMQQGPPLLLATAYKAHLARTARQNI